MAVRFFVETSKLRSTANEFQNSAQIWGNTIQRMLDTVNATGYEWVGSASDSYRRKFAQHAQDRKDILSLINEHMEDLRRIAQNIDQNESNLASEASGLRTDVVH